jgi:chorismate mutase
MVTLELNLIAAHLEGLEETIIHRLIDRAQFAANPGAYVKGHSGFEGAGEKSLFDVRLRYQEEMDAAFGRYQVPEERPFHTDLPAPRRQVRLPDSPLDVDDLDVVTVTPAIVCGYQGFLDRLCAPAAGTAADPATVPVDDGQYGSSVEHDVLAIQAIARRVHFGALYVAESKYRSQPEAFNRMLDAADRQAVLHAITRPEVEKRILTRVAEKVDYVQATINESVRRRVERTVVLDLYRDLIIPLTKEGEVRYLFNRRR